MTGKKGVEAVEPLIRQAWDRSRAGWLEPTSKAMRMPIGGRWNSFSRPRPKPCTMPGCRRTGRRRRTQTKQPPANPGAAAFMGAGPFGLARWALFAALR